MAVEYRDLIFTNHAQVRLKDRSLVKENVYLTIHQADKKKKMTDGKIKFIKTINQRRYQVVATYLNQDNKWLVISNWVRGEEDKLPLAWQLLSLPFKIVFYLLKEIFKATFSKKKKRVD